MTTRRKRKFWSRSFGEYGCTVRVYERPGGVLSGEVRARGQSRRASLGHRDRDRAIAWAKDQLGRLRLGLAAASDPTPTVARVFAAYLATQTPRKGRSSQYQDRRAAAMWTRVLGATKDLSKLTRAEWQAFTDARAAGAIDARGAPVPEAARRPVRPRAVENDCEWLGWVLTWATRWQDADGRYLLRENPARGYPIPHEKNPRRPVATADRYAAVRAVAERVPMEVRADGKRRAVPSYLPELLDVANGTGRRISAVLALRYVDLALERPPGAPHGAIRWPADTDKMGKAWAAPIAAPVRAALDRVLAARPGLGAAYLFPSPRRPDRPVSYDLAAAWLARAEQLAGLPKQDGSLWHAYRRKWATERKHLPDVDVAAAGGWSDLASLKTAYQQVDDATLYRVVSEPAELREAQA